MVFLALLLAQVPAYSFNGDDQQDYLGQAVGSCGDVDGDGVRDVLVGVIGEDGPANYAGAVRVYSGALGQLLYQCDGDYQGNRLGRSVCSLGDVDDDGHAEFVAGASNFGANGFNSGLVRVYDGSDGSVRYQFLGDQPHDQLGWQVRAAGDLDRDGVTDLVVGARQVSQALTAGPGFVRTFSGRTGQLLWTVHGDTLGDTFGWSVAAAGDVDLDGWDDVLVGAPRYANDIGNEPGYARVLSGLDGQVLLSVSGSAPGDRFGHAVASGADLDGDGFVELIVGAPEGALQTVTAGYVRIYSGRDGTLLDSLSGDADGDGFGGAIALALNLDGDAIADLLVGSPTNDQAGLGAGLVRAFAGATRAPLFDVTGGAPGDLLGSALDTCGDLNGDGYDEFVAGAWCATVGANLKAGYARVYLSQAAAPASYCSAKPNSAGCLPAVTAEGAASASLATTVRITAVNVLNAKPGLAFWSRGPAAAQPFFGGTLCMLPPLVRTPVQTSGGAPPPGSDCSGAYLFSWGLPEVTAAGLLPGDAVFVQFWSRDPAHPDGTGVGLTDAVSFTVVP